MSPANGHGNDPVFQDAFPEDNVLFELMYLRASRLLGFSTPTSFSSIYDAVHRVFHRAFGVVTFLLRKFAGRTSPGDYHVTRPTYATTSICAERSTIHVGQHPLEIPGG